MTDADFIYYYAKLYNQFNVKAVLLRENWQDKDFDAKYAKYMQEYIRFKKIVVEKGYSDEKIIEALNAFKANRLDSVYKFLLKDMKTRLEDRINGHLNPEKERRLLSKLGKLATMDDVNFDYLYELRKFEEEEY
jgi:hypothetical protein